MKHEDWGVAINLLSPTLEFPLMVRGASAYFGARNRVSIYNQWPEPIDFYTAMVQIGDTETNWRFRGQPLPSNWTIPCQMRKLHGEFHGLFIDVLFLCGRMDRSTALEICIRGEVK